jgi:hypothetical protein
MLTWNDIDVRGRHEYLADAGAVRLYVCEHFSSIEAWVGREKIGKFEEKARTKRSPSHAGKTINLLGRGDRRLVLAALILILAH